MSRPRVRGTLYAAAVSGAALAAAAALPGAAAAASRTTAPTSTVITVEYPVSGTTHLKAPNATTALGPGTLRSTLDLGTGRMKARLALPAATVSFKMLGLIPVSAVTEFIQDGPTTGRVNLNTGAVHSTSKVTLRITSLTVAGISIPVGNQCQSASPAVIKLASQPGFSVAKGGNLSGVYTVPPFAGCGLVTPVINLSTTGPGNTITLTLGKGKRVQ